MDERSKSKIKEFLNEYYSEISHATMRGAIERHLFGRNHIEDYRKITYQDYIRLSRDLSNGDFNETSFTNCESFIKYLYANGELINDSGFKDEWFTKDILEHFQGNKNRLLGIYKIDKTQKNRTVLNIEELSKIKKFLDIETENTKTYKQQFSWFLLFEVGLAVEDVRKIKLKETYNKGILSLVTGRKIKIPQKFHNHIEKHKETSQDSFKAVNIWIKDLGESLQIDIPLKPFNIKNTREKMLISCSNCQQVLIRDTDNWLAIEGWIVCKECANELKKKNEVGNVDSIDNFEIETKDEMNERVFISYNESKTQLLEKSIDYLKLHEFQMLIGELGEQYVFEYEMAKLEGTTYVDRIDKSKAKVNSNGYDILSFTTKGKKVHIEVKTTSTLNDEFYISQHELEIAEQMKNNGEMYKVYFVKDILGEPQLTIIDNILEEIDFKKTGHSWKMIKE